jgi:hypothetical protein
MMRHFARRCNHFFASGWVKDCHFSTAVLMAASAPATMQLHSLLALHGTRRLADGRLGRAILDELFVAEASDEVNDGACVEDVQQAIREIDHALEQIARGSFQVVGEWFKGGVTYVMYIARHVYQKRHEFLGCAHDQVDPQPIHGPDWKLQASEQINDDDYLSA